VDCALWDLAAKQAGRTIASLAGVPALKPVTTAYTLSLDSASAMGAAARAEAARPLLKLKVGGGDDLDRIRAVHAGAPQARLLLARDRVPGLVYAGSVVRPAPAELWG